MQVRQLKIVKWEGVYVLGIIQTNQSYLSDNNGYHIICCIYWQLNDKDDTSSRIEKCVIKLQ